MTAMSTPAARWSPSVTVAAIVCDHSQPPRYLLVEEQTPEGLRLNNPAGHLDPGETPEQGVVRETLEETARVFVPTALVGVYLSRFVRPATGEDVTYLRFAYAGHVGEPVPGRLLDEPIERTLWLTLDEIRAALPRLRSELVLRCVLDHAAGVRHPLIVVTDDGTLQVPVVKMPLIKA
jgi:8-oxo-dGTP pyrophosphatase MutT (NUDIX family)